MKTVEMTLEDDLLEEVDRTAAALGTSRSDFTREALRSALDGVRTRELERRHREGYEKFPPQPGEFDVWEAEQVWVE